MTQQTSTDQARQTVQDLIADIKVALLVTRAADGNMSARPMAAVSNTLDDGLWFFSRFDSPKTGELLHDRHVLLAYSEPKSQNYVSIAGHAEIVRDFRKVEELWSESARTWFPKGPSDPAISLIHVEPHSAEYWDAPSSAWVQAYGYVKARLTGTPPHPVENKIVNL